MPRPVRTADPASAQGILEDLKMVRQAGGLGETNTFHVSNLLTIVQSIDGDVSATFDEAKRYVRSATLARCWLKSHGSTDNCERATAQAVRNLLLHSHKGITVEAVRRRVLRASACALSSDGLRKREDRLLEEIAGEIWDFLQGPYVEARREYPMTVVTEMQQSVADLRLNIYSIKRYLYPKEEPPSVPRVEELVSVILHEIGEVHHYARRLLGAVTAVVEPTSLDTYLRLMSVLLLEGPVFNGPDDQRTFENLWQTHQSVPVDELFGSLLDANEEFVENFLDWLDTCHKTCAFERTLNHGLMCRAHRYVTLLQQVEGVIEDIYEGNDLTYLDM